MSERDGYHRPLMAGISIRGALADEQGTLTGIAIRDSDKKRVLVTNLHVLVGTLLQVTPHLGLALYQLEQSETRKVGINTQWVPIHTTTAISGVTPIKNYADVVIAEVVDTNPAPPGTSFKCHGEEPDDHNGGVIIPGVRTPEMCDELLLVAKSGTY